MVGKFFSTFMRYFFAAFVACAILAACGNPVGLPLSSTNTIDTVSLYALTGTPISQPSGYSIIGKAAVRTDLVTTFDFAFDIDTLGQAKFLPTSRLHMGTGSGFQISAQNFDSIKFAPTGGYNVDSALVLHENTVALAHSATFVCPTGIQTVLYAKLHVLAIDTTAAARSIKFEVLVDGNCGFRGLQEGLPHN